MKILLSNKTYDILKWVCLVGMHALSVLVLALDEIWGIPYAGQIALTIEAIATFLGALIGVSCAQYKERPHDAG